MTEIELLTAEFLLASLLLLVHVEVISNVPGLGVVGSGGRGAGRTGGARVTPGPGGAMGGGF